MLKKLQGYVGIRDRLGLYPPAKDEVSRFAAEAAKVMGRAQMPPQQSAGGYIDGGFFTGIIRYFTSPDVSTVRKAGAILLGPLWFAAEGAHETLKMARDGQYGAAIWTGVLTALNLVLMGKGIAKGLTGGGSTQGPPLAIPVVSALGKERALQYKAVGFSADLAAKGMAGAAALKNGLTMFTIGGGEATIKREVNYPAPRGGASKT